MFNRAMLFLSEGKEPNEQAPLTAGHVGVHGGGGGGEGVVRG